MRRPGPRASATIVALAALAGSLSLAPAAGGQSSVPTLSAQALPGQISYGASTRIAGSLANAAPVAGQTLSLQASPYPYATWQPLATVQTGQDGSFSVAVQPDRNTRYRVISAALGVTSAPVAVTVDEIVLAHVRYLALGRVGVSISSVHAAGLHWNDRRAHWYLATGSSTRYEPVVVTRTYRVNGSLTHVKAVFQTPAGRFHYLECFAAPDGPAMGPASAHAPCPAHAFVRPRHTATAATLTDAGGSGDAPEGFPFPRRVASARRYLESRGGRTGFAVVDSEGRISGLNIHRTFVTGSVVKAMLLVAYLDMLADQHRGLDPFSRSILYPMINVSDNDAATAVWSIVGDGALYALARRARMTDFSISGIWANALLSPADQARFFFNMNNLIAPQFRGYARLLLSTIAGYESWGIPLVARSVGWTVYFKGGWRSTGLGELIHQIARLHKGRTTFAMAVMTDGDPTLDYGVTNVQGVTARLLGLPLPPPSMAPFQ